MSAPRPEVVLRSKQNIRNPLSSDITTEPVAYVNASYTPHKEEDDGKEEEYNSTIMRLGSSSFARKNCKDKAVVINDLDETMPNNASTSNATKSKVDLHLSLNKADAQSNCTSDEPHSSKDIHIPQGFSDEFHGILSKFDCEKILLKDGQYLVRKSSSKKNAAHMIVSLRQVLI